MVNPVLTLEGLSKYYTGRQSVVVGLNNVSLSFCRGEFVAITGESGSGKSTMAHVIGGILPYESGELLLGGAPTSHYDSTDWERYRRDYVSFISQSYGILPGCSVMGNVVSALRLSGMEKAEAAKAAEKILKQVELWEFRTRRAAKLSSGQKQRLSIARALAKPAPILIADEPTGNLDAENSAKVIKLLAQAARDRLVILITHDFQEAENCATRHITLQDGRVIMDAALRPAYEPEEILPARTEKSRRRPLASYVAGLQLRSRPVWTTLMVLFFTLTAFAVFAFLGTFIVALDDTSVRIYDDSAFLNGDRQRIVAARIDGEAFTREDFDKILSLKYVEALEPWGFAADVHYAYREGQDYKLTYQVQGTGPRDDRDLYTSSSVQILGGSPYIKTIPMLSGGREFLSAGRLPETICEVVIAGPESLIGSTMTVYIQDTKNWAINSMLEVDVEVVGVTAYGSGLYFHEDLGRIFNHLTVSSSRILYMPVYDDPELGDDECRASAYITSQFEGYKLDHLYVSNMNEWDPDNPDEHPSVVLYFDQDEDGQHVSHSAFFNDLLYVSPATFDRLTWKGGTEQVSITIDDYAYTDRVLNSLSAAGYLSLSPYQSGSTEKDPDLEAARIQTLTVCCAALAAVIFLQIILLRAMFSVETESYRLLSNIGLTSRPARQSVLYQILLFTLTGQILGFGGILLCGALGVQKIVSLLRYLPPAYFLILCAVHLAASVIAALWISHALGKQVYPLAGRQSDLDFDSEEGEVSL